MKKKWSERKEKEREAKQNAEERAKWTVKADYQRRKKAGQLTKEEEQKENRNEQRRQSRRRWDDFCFEIRKTLILRSIGETMHKEPPPPLPSLKEIVKVAEHVYKLKITEGRLAQLKRVFR